jgi:hypothetical protein
MLMKRALAALLLFIFATSFEGGKINRALADDPPGIDVQNLINSYAEAINRLQNDLVLEKSRVRTLQKMLEEERAKNSQPPDPTQTRPFGYTPRPPRPQTETPATPQQ